MSENDAMFGSLAMLIGGKITAVIHTPESEDGDVYWGLQIEVGKKTKIISLWLLSDFEGNAPGAWDIEEIAQ
jgi:hypothetical protein